MAWTKTRSMVGLFTLALAAVMVYDAAPVLAQAKKSDAVVKATATADKPDADGKQTVTITLEIEKPWHIYANPVENEDMASVQTVVKVTSKADLKNVKIDYPTGKIYGEKDEKCRIYEGKIIIKAHLTRAKDDNGPLEVSIQLQACNASSCLLPATIKKDVP